MKNIFLLSKHFPVFDRGGGGGVALLVREPAPTRHPKYRHGVGNLL